MHITLGDAGLQIVVVSKGLSDSCFLVHFSLTEFSLPMLAYLIETGTRFWDPVTSIVSRRA